MAREDALSASAWRGGRALCVSGRVRKQLLEFGERDAVLSPDSDDRYLAVVDEVVGSADGDAEIDGEFADREVGRRHRCDRSHDHTLAECSKLCNDFGCAFA